MFQYQMSQFAGEDLFCTNYYCNDGNYSKYFDKPPKLPNIRAGDEEFPAENHSYKLSQLHRHEDFVEIVYVNHGKAVAICNNTKRMVQKGDILCIPLGCVHANFPLPKLGIYNCLISTQALKKDFGLFSEVFDKNGQTKIDIFNRFTGSTLLEVEHLCELMLRESEKRPAYYRESLLNYTNQLLIQLCRCDKERIKNVRSNRVLSQILDYISEYYPIATLNHTAKEFSYNPTYLSRIFHQTFSIHFTEYVNKLRVEKAIDFLSQSDMPVEEICISVGFKSKLHFYDVFKKHTGLTPGELRKHLTRYDV